MELPKRYNPRTSEPELVTRWQERGVTLFDRAGEAPVYSIDTPPPTVSGRLHLGHVYSYSHADFIARYKRMNGYNVYYPMGFDDNGLPTGRLVERLLGKRAQEIGREAFIAHCLAISEEAEVEYRELWTRLGLSIDWRFTYRTIDDLARRIAQESFLDLLEKGLAYRQKSPAIWCPECGTALAQADLDDLERETVFYTLAFALENGRTLPVATTRPELLPACVAVFVHPEDGRYHDLIGSQVRVPLFNQNVPLLADPSADPQKGTGAVMCCTFGDLTDIAWWRSFELPLVEVVAHDGTLSAAADEFAGLKLGKARSAIIDALAANDLLLGSEPMPQSVRVHERCDTPVEYVVTPQWFVRILDHKDTLQARGEEVQWHPAHMAARYRQWVENLNWDWCISRQRFFGVPFPIWTCDDCGELLTANRNSLPVDPREKMPDVTCPHCGGHNFSADPDVMDTWATSSMTPQIAGRWQEDDELYKKVFPFSCRPQAQEIIRTWAFYTIVKSEYHFQLAPWSDALISGWGLAPEGTAKLSKSRGGGPAAPLEMMERYSADALRYWAASTALGKDAIIDEQRIQAGAKLATKLWNVARFCGRFLRDYEPPKRASAEVSFTPADRWILARTAQVIDRCTALWEQYDYASARSEVEIFFWRDLADNYLEMVKKRLYDGENSEGARFTIYYALLSTLKLFAPIMPFVTERIYGALFSVTDGAESIHRAAWPKSKENWRSEAALAFGDVLLAMATAVRRFKSENQLSLGAEIQTLHLATADPQLAAGLQAAIPDLAGLTRAKEIRIASVLDGRGVELPVEGEQKIRAAVNL